MDRESRELAERLIAGTGLDYVGIAPLRAGREHNIFTVSFRGGELRLLKVPRPDAMGDPFWPERRGPYQGFFVEREAISLVEGLDVPRPYHILPTQPRCVLMGIVPGITPEIAWERGMMDESLLEAVARAMGGMLGRIHAIRRQPETAIPVLPGSTEDDDLRLLHMDFHLGNVLGKVRMGGRFTPTGIIDWTWAKWGPREADFMEMGVSVFITNSWALEPMLEGYRDVSGVMLEPRRIYPWILREMDRRLRDDPPTDPEELAIWQQRRDDYASGKL